jgi:hypothetical protein
MTKTASKNQILFARLVVVLMIAFAVFGAVWYGFSEEVRHRVWQQLIDRPTGPMAFWFILQPAMAAIAAMRDGIDDAKSGRSPYFWTLLSNPLEHLVASTNWSPPRGSFFSGYAWIWSIS